MSKAGAEIPPWMHLHAMKPDHRQALLFQWAGLLLLLALTLSTLGCNGSGVLSKPRSHRQTGWIRVANFTDRSIPVTIEGQSLGNGLAPGVPGPFYKKKAGTVEVAVDGDANSALVLADEASTIYLIERDDKIQSVLVGGEPRKGRVASAGVQVINLLDDEEIRCKLTSGQFGIEIAAGAKSGSGTLVVDSGSYEIAFWIPGGAPSRISAEFEKGKGYSIAILGVKKDLRAKVLDNNPKSDMAMGQESGT